LNSRRVTETALRRAGLYAVARTVYLRVARPERLASLQRRDRLLREFVRPGGLVFDVGANRGDYAEMFARLGARVIAIEPTPELIEEIRLRAPSAVIERCAVGGADGEGHLFVGASDGDSTLSADYVDVLERELGVQMRPLNVRVVTLDTLIARHGRPDFVKIDVEGFEPEVLKGLGQPVPALSFEYHGSLPDASTECLRLLDGCEFRLSLGQDYRWDSGWVDRDEIAALITGHAAADPKAFGDVYARRRD
jgi:FkbM family methyltransferase